MVMRAMVCNSGFRPLLHRLLLVTGVVLSAFTTADAQRSFSQGDSLQREGNRSAQDSSSQENKREQQGKRQESPGSSDNKLGERVIRLADLPSAPEPIKGLMKRGEFRFLTGGQPQSSLGPLSSGGRLAGETRFKFRYRYDSRARWSFDRTFGGTPRQGAMVNIVVRFRTLKLFLSHDVWLREMPQQDQFWTDRVVLHEFDHVRISSDPRIEKLFYDEARQLERFQVPYSKVAQRGGAIDSRRVQQLIEERMKEVLAKTSEMVRIRYRELDRLTEHGLRPIPNDADFSY